MFVLGNIILGIATVLGIALKIYMWIVIIRALLSWVNPDPYNSIVQFLNRATEPVLRPIRKFLPPWKMGLDVSPLIVIFVIYFMQIALVDTLARIGRSLQ